MKKYLLIATDGYSIDYTQYDTMEVAQEAMRTAYAKLTPEENDESSEEMSYLGETDATLYANGENVYVWTIATVSFDN